MRGLPLIAGLVVSLLAGSVHAESIDWLLRMAQAVRMQNYEGVMVYARDGRMESMRIVHRYQDGDERERLQALSGDGREIHRNNDVVTCILPKDRAVKVDRRDFRGLLPALNQATVQEISENYELQEHGSEKLIGRVCRAVSMRPRDAYRYGYRIWIDEETAVPLKVELLSAEGVMLEQVMFTQISFPAKIKDSALAPTVDAKDFAWIRQNTPKAANPNDSQGWAAARLPPGFRMVMHEQQSMPDQPEPVEHMVFTDGLATVSAFMAPAGSPGKFIGLSRRGAMTAYARTVDDYHVTVMGEVPQATVELIANQLHYQPQTVAAPAQKLSPQGQ